MLFYVLQNYRMHAFVPGTCAEDLEPQINLGKVCIFRKFTVQEYKPDDNFRCVRNKVQLIMSNETKIKQIEDDGRSIPKTLLISTTTPN